MYHQTPSNNEHKFRVGNRVRFGMHAPSAAIVWEDIANAPIEYLAPEQMAGSQAWSTIRRLLVLVPDKNLDEDRLVMLLGALARISEVDVLFLSLRRYREEGEGSFLNLIDLSSKGRGVGLRARAQQVDFTEWLGAVGSVYQNGDLVVICEGIMVREDDWRQRPVAPLIAEQFHAPVCILAGVYTPPMTRPVKKALGLMTWLIPVVFLWIQWQLIGAASGTLQTLLLSLSVIIEFGLILILDYLAHT